jgi:hypothetical protein
LACAPFNWQLTGSYFVVAHFHYVIVGGILFCIFAAFYYWFPKMSGRMLSETLGKWHFWLFVIGFHLTFDFMHAPGLLGMPRRIYTYEAGRGWGWDTWNLIVTIGVFFQAAATLIFAWNLLRSYFKGKPAGNDPWDAWTLEWATCSPARVYNFASLPVVRSRRPLWDLKHPDDPDWIYEPDEVFQDAKTEDNKVVQIPASTPSPIILASGIAMLFAGLVTTELVSVLGIILTLCGCVAWFRDVLPHEKHESIATAGTDPVSTKYAVLWGALKGHGVWHPINLLAAVFSPERATMAQLGAFHWDALIVGAAILVLGTVLVGLLYGAILPMVPRHPIFLGGVVMPIFGSALAYSILGTVNPVFRDRIDWPLVHRLSSGIRNRGRSCRFPH